MNAKSLTLFADESNHIEGIGEANPDEIEALARLLHTKTMQIGDLELYVLSLRVHGPLRSRAGMDVRVGSHIAMPGGFMVPVKLEALLHRINTQQINPFDAHVEYETLHPFMDGNGRSGRALWLWHHRHNNTHQMPLALGFLHTFYYEILSNSRKDKA